MQNVLANIDDAVHIPQQHPGLVSRIVKDYRNNLGIFWGVMLPLIILNFFLYMGIFLFSKLSHPEVQWSIDTQSSLVAYALHPQSTQPTGFVSGMYFSFPIVSISLLWLAICPLTYIIGQRRNGIDMTFKVVWQQTLRKTFPILGTAFLILLFESCVPLISSFFISEFLGDLLPSYASTLLFVSAWLSTLWYLFTIYYIVKWSLYNQEIILENRSVIAALRRSSALARGAWWRFFRVYLLLIWASMVLTSVLLGLTLVLLSFAVPELLPIRELLQPANFVGLFVGAYGSVILERIPNAWIIAVMVSVHTLLHAMLAPIWASLTTQLYIERTDRQVQEVSA